MEAMNSSVSRIVIAGNALRFDYSGVDYHPTPSAATEDILWREELIPPVWEPASGDGAISIVVEGLGFEVRSSDILDKDWIYGERGVDFLAGEIQPCGTIITNPPYNHLNEFAVRALQSAEKVMLLIHSRALSGKMRYEAVYRPYPPRRVYQYCRPIPYWFNGEWRRGGAVVHSWVVWERPYTGYSTELRWIY